MWQKSTSVAASTASTPAGSEAMPASLPPDRARAATMARWRWRKSNASFDSSGVGGREYASLYATAICASRLSPLPSSTRAASPSAHSSAGALFSIVNAWIGLVDDRRLLIHVRVHDQAMHRFDAPALTDELDGQPVEELGMRRPCAGGAEVARRRDEAAAEMIVPDPVHHHARGERILGTRDPIGQRGAAAGRLRAGPRRDRGRGGADGPHAA